MRTICRTWLCSRLAIIRKKDVDEPVRFRGALDMAFENCHLEYWYPDDKKNRT